MKNLQLLETFFQKPVLALAELKAAGFEVEEKMFVSLGGGVGSFCWVNSLRVHAVAQANIAVIAQHCCPYQQFKTYCDRSGLTAQDRLRSDSSARPDNLWGFPGYAVSEFLADLQAGHWLAAAKVGWQIFAEPFGCDFYTPAAGRLYAAMDREMLRIGWAAMLRQGTALFLRKLSDGRLAIFYQEPTRQICVIVANIVHLALGHTVRRSDYLRNLTEQMKTELKTDQVLSGYELEEDFFQTVEETGALVVVVGRGIVAARIIERLLPREPQLAKRKVISLVRSPLAETPDSRNLQQAVLAAWRLQPFNWPRSTFGGPLKETLQQVPPTERRQLARVWSAASTSPRRAWLRDLKKAQAVNAYRTVYGQIDRVEQQNSRLAIAITPYEKATGETLTLKADYLVDCSGFDDQVAYHFLYEDLMQTYQVATTPAGTLQVNDHFEIEALASDQGKVVVSGSGAAGNHYGPVDSFLGQQYVALQAMQRLATLPWSGVRRLNALSSAYGWLQWVGNRPI